MILEGLFDSLRELKDALLVIKAHPYDASDLYTKAIEDAGMSDRVRLVDTPPHELFQEASVVITEDTTAGMEAMFDGKIIVHAHFAPTDPTVDYVGYGAALAGRSREQLRESLRNVAHLSRAGRDDMHRAQHKFLHDHAGPCDGRAEERVRSFILKVLEAG